MLKSMLTCVCCSACIPVLLLGCNECPGGLRAPRCLSDQQVNRIKGCSEAFRGRRTGSRFLSLERLQSADRPSVFTLTLSPSHHFYFLWTCRSELIVTHDNDIHVILIYIDISYTSSICLIPKCIFSGSPLVFSSLCPAQRHTEMIPPGRV